MDLPGTGSPSIDAVDRSRSTNCHRALIHGPAHNQTKDFGPACQASVAAKASCGVLGVMDTQDNMIKKSGYFQNDKLVYQ